VDVRMALIDVSAHQPRRISSKNWRELIKKVWEANPLRCPKCSREMRIVSLIDEEDVIERILRHLELWQEGGACIPAPTRRAKRPSIRGSTTLPRLQNRTGRGVPGLSLSISVDLLIAKTTPDVGRRSTALSKCCRTQPVCASR
jgi:hypothetical protein